VSPGIGAGIGIGPFHAGALPFYHQLLGYSPLLMLVAGEQCYTDAAKAVGCTDTDAVYTWGNLGTDSTDAVQSTEASRFAYSAAGGVGGRPGCSMDGAADFMDLTGLASTSNDYTVFAVVNKVATSFGYLFSTAGTGGQAHAYSSDLGGEVEYVNDSAGASVLQASMTGEQMLTWRVEGTADVECWRDGALLAVGSGEAGNNPEIGGTTYLGKNKNGTNWDEGVYSFFMIVPSKLSDADVAAVHAILLAEYGLAFVAQSIANAGLAWDADDATLSGSDIATLTDTSGNSHTINLVGTVGAVTIGSHQYCRFNGSDNGLQVADHATLDGSTGCTHVLRVANASGILSSAATVAQKGRAGTHINGGIGDTALGAGTRFAALMNSADELDVGPVPSASADTEESLAMAVDSASAVRRVDPDDTYATNATAATITVGAGSLTYGMQETGAGTYDEWADVDVSAGIYYARDLNQYELEAAKTLLDP